MPANKMCLLLFLLYLPSTFCSVDIEQSHVWKNDLNEVISQIASEKEATTYLTTLVIIHTNDSDVTAFVKTHAVIVVSEDHIYPYKQFKYSTIIYFIDSSTNSLNIVSNLKCHVNSTKWDPNIKMLIVLTQIIPQEMELEVKYGLRDFFTLSWNFHYLNIAAIYWSASENHLQVVTYNPFLRTVRKSNYLKSVKVFDNNLTNLHGYPLRVVQVPYVPRAYSIIRNGTNNLAGVDKKIILTLIHHLNATGKMDYQNTISLYSIRQIIRGLASNTSDIFFNLVALQPSVAQNLYPFIRDDVCVLVPNSDEIPVYLKMFFPFSILGWAIIFFSVICVEVLWYFLKINDNIFNHKSTENSLVLNFWKLVLPLLNFSPGFSFQHSSSKEKLLLIMWLIYCFYICTAYQSVLCSFLTVPKYSDELNSVKDIERSGIKVMAAKADIDFLEHLENIDQSFVAQLKSYAYFQGKFENRSIGFLLRALMGKFYINHQDKLGNNIRYRFAEDCILPSIATYYVNPQSAFINRFNDLLARVIESGITTKLSNDAQHEFFMSVKKMPLIGGNEEDKSQNLSDLYFAFYLLLIGYAISSITFIIEITVYDLKYNKKRKF